METLMDKADETIVPKWTNMRKNTLFWFLKIPSVWLCRSFQKVKKALFYHFLASFLCTSVLACTLTKKVHGNFRFPFKVICVKVHGNFHVTFHLICLKVHGNFHVPFGGCM